MTRGPCFSGDKPALALSPDRAGLDHSHRTSRLIRSGCARDRLLVATTTAWARVPSRPASHHAHWPLSPPAGLAAKSTTVAPPASVLPRSHLVPSLGLSHPGLSRLPSAQCTRARMVAREGFEPSKALGRQIYSLLRLTAPQPRRTTDRAETRWTRIRARRGARGHQACYRSLLENRVELAKGFEPPTG